MIARLFEVGCDDALASTTDGVQCIDFARGAASFDAAVLSAVADVDQLAVSAWFVWPAQAWFPLRTSRPATGAPESPKPLDRPFTNG